MRDLVPLTQKTLKTAEVVRKSLKKLKKQPAMSFEELKAQTKRRDIPNMTSMGNTTAKSPPSGN